MAAARVFVILAPSPSRLLLEDREPEPLLPEEPDDESESLLVEEEELEDKLLLLDDDKLEDRWRMKGRLARTAALLLVV